MKLSIPKPTSEMLPANAPAMMATKPSNEFHAIVKYSRCSPRRTTALRSKIPVSAIAVVYTNIALTLETPPSLVIALLERRADATISLMLGRHRTPYSRGVGIFLVTVFAITTVASSICPVCLAKDFGIIQRTSTQNLTHHPDSQDCDRDGCSCCGFHFLAPAHDIFSEAVASTAPPTPSIAVLPTEYPFDFYRPPRS